MKFSCTQENLLRALNILSHLATKSSTLPILNHLLVIARGEGVTLSATNLELAITCSVRGKVEKEGEFTVPASIISSYVALLPEGVLHVELQGKDFCIKTEGQKTKIRGEGASEFPVIPHVESGKEYVCDRNTLRSGLIQVSLAASLDETRPEISGVLFYFVGNALTLAATDSYRLAEKKIPLSKTSGDLRVILPQRTIQEILRILSILQENEIILLVSENQVLVKGDGVKITSRLIEGNYPNYEQIIPKQFRTEAKIQKDGFLKAIKSASLFTKTGINDVHLLFSQEKQSITLSSVNAQVGEHTAEISSFVSGEDNDIVFNYRYLLDGLASFNGEEISVRLIDNSSPGTFRSSAEDGHTYLVMPIRQ